MQHIFIRQRQNKTGNSQQAKTGISEAGQRRKQFQAGVGSQAQVQSIRAVRGQTQKSEEWGNAQKCQPGQEQDFAMSRRKSRAYVVCVCVCVIG